MKTAIKILLFLLPTIVSSQSTLPYKNKLPKIKSNGTIEMPDKTTIKIEGFNDKDKTVFFIVRHAEKDTAGGTNADLNAIGRGRAKALVTIFKKITIDNVYSTDKPRTRNTAKPMADAKHHMIEIYDAKKQAELLSSLVETHKGQKIFMVGHSNTVPQIVNILLRGSPDGKGGDSEKEFSEADYSRLYIIVVRKIGDAAVQLIRF